MTVRHVAAGVIGLAGLALAIVLLARESGPLASLEARVLVPDATAVLLDTIAVRGRRVEASLDGHVAEIGADGTVWLSVAGDAFPLRIDDGHGLDIEDRVLAVGRLRARGGRRWLDVSAWSVVVADVRAPSGAGH
ncbi:hypothetical protein [Rubrivirga sp. IMCC43871]|uniref:hypothetical protein n=1 Tax=Rubrivirga sp. IMCC43871 TaxID=3391575 RepID=UPI00398F9B46